MPITCGGVGEAKPADATVQGLCDQVKGQMEEKHGRAFGTFLAVVYKTQMVNGTNYFIKVDVGDGECYHVRLHKPFSEEKVTLSSSQPGKTKEEEISYF